MARIGGKIMEYITLNNGVKMPMAGFGVFQIKDKEECVRAVSYTHLIVRFFHQGQISKQ